MEGQFPQVGDYYDWLRDTRDCFATDSRFHGAEIESDGDDLWGRSGRFGVVFKVIHAGQFTALKCFTEPDPGRSDRYRLLGAVLNRVQANWVVQTELDEQGITGWDLKRWPTLAMPWIGGDSLVDWLDDRAGDREAIERCRMDFARTIQSMERSGLAHGDLQPDNILVEAGDRIRLIDYDSMYVAGLESNVLRHSGVGSYQHPAWENQGLLSPTMDRFPARLIHLSLLALTYEPGLWTELHTDGSNALFLEMEDLADPARSTRLAQLARLDDPTIQAEVGQLRSDLRQRGLLTAIPALDPKFTAANPLREPTTATRPLTAKAWPEKAVVPLEEPLTRPDIIVTPGSLTGPRSSARPAGHRVTPSPPPSRSAVPHERGSSVFAHTEVRSGAAPGRPPHRGRLVHLSTVAFVVPLVIVLALFVIVELFLV